MARTGEKKGPRSRDVELEKDRACNVGAVGIERLQVLGLENKIWRGLRAGRGRRGGAKTGRQGLHMLDGLFAGSYMVFTYNSCQLGLPSMFGNESISQSCLVNID